MSTSSSKKRGHENLSLDNESCSSNGLQVKIDPETLEPFKYSKEVERAALIEFIVVESLYNRSFEDALANYVKIFYNPLEYSEELDRAELVKFICAESILYTTSFMNSLTIYIRAAHYPEYKSIPRSTIKSEIGKQYLKYQKEIIENFKCLSSKVALAVDITHLPEIQEDVLCITANWIDDNYVMQKRILAYIAGLVDEIHDGREIACMIIKSAHRYCLNKKILSISFDNESNNELAIQLLKEYLKPGFDQVFNLKCACHILNLIVRDGMTHFKPKIEKIRKAVRYIKSSSLRETIFSKKCLANNLMVKCLSSDIPTLWNTTYDMLFRAMECKTPLTEIYNQSVHGDEDILSDRDLVICEDIVIFLQKFYNAIIHFSAGAYYPTSNSTIVYLNDIASLFFKFKDKPFFSDILPDMRDKFVKYFIPVPAIYLIGTLLDPTMKLQHIEVSLKFLYQNLELNYSEKDLDSHKQELLKLANDIYSHYEVAHEKHRQSSMPASTTSSCTINRFPGCEFWQHVMSHEPGPSNFNELSFYLQQRHDIDDSDFDVLAWWKENTKQFPVLSRMARDVLAVPVSSIELDRVFNQGMLELGEDKCQLVGSRTFERMECLKDWVKAERRLQGLPKIDEEYINDFFCSDVFDFEDKCNMTDDVEGLDE